MRKCRLCSFSRVNNKKGCCVCLGTAFANSCLHKLHALSTFDGNSQLHVISALIILSVVIVPFLSDPFVDVVVFSCQEVRKNIDNTFLISTSGFCFLPITLFHT